MVICLLLLGFPTRVGLVEWKTKASQSLQCVLLFILIENLQHITFPSPFFCSPHLPTDIPKVNVRVLGIYIFCVYICNKYIYIIVLCAYNREK